MDAHEPKLRLRREFRRLRREHLPQAQAGILAVARRVLPSLVAEDQRMGIWWPLGGEPDLLSLAHGRGDRLSDRLALPAVLPDRRLVYLPWQVGEALDADACGIPAPHRHGLGAIEPLAPSDLALLLVPALAVDPSGLRLGSGGGWYDRLRADPAWRCVPAFAVLPAACVCPALPRDPWDIPFDGWLDETGLHRAHASGPTMASS